ncbi:Non-ribosomal peptide synthetase module [Candidatus Burkholderia humilis]|nr:Non-ribosomal peptide synthetase module [Candidatus Burkholderia humilis]
MHAHEIEARCAQAQRSLNIHEGPLIRAVIMPINDGTWRLFIVIHHLAVDAVSWRILFGDLQLACTQLAASEAIALPDRTASYRTFVRALQKSTCDAQLDYWRNVNTVAASLPSTPSNTQSSRAIARLNRNATRTLLQEANTAYRTQINDLLLVAISRTLCRFANVDSLRIDVEGHGRCAVA